MFKIFKHHRGETLSETIFALSILAVGISMAGTITASSLRNIENARNRIIAVNLAREGVEAVRNIRDSNWLKYSSIKRLCWNNEPSQGCDRGNQKPISTGDYIAYLNTDQKWDLLPYEVKCENGTLVQDHALNCGAQKIKYDNSLLFLADTDTNGDADIYNHSTRSDLVYSETLPDPISPHLGFWGAAVKSSPFSRIVTLKYLTNAGAVGNPSDNRMEVTSLVRWNKGGSQYQVELKTHLSDYLGRTDLNQ